MPGMKDGGNVCRTDYRHGWNRLKRYHGSCGDDNHLLTLWSFPPISLETGTSSRPSVEKYTLDSDQPPSLGRDKIGHLRPIILRFSCWFCLNLCTITRVLNFFLVFHFLCFWIPPFYSWCFQTYIRLSFRWEAELQSCLVVEGKRIPLNQKKQLCFPSVSAL